jgi:3-oxoacyl-[acyl-carrier protein] reductase
VKLLSEKVAIVTGGSRGIGRAVARAFAEHGARVVISYASAEEAAESLVADARRDGLEVSALKGSVADLAHVKQLVAETRARHGRIDVLVNNAGITRDGFLMMMKEADWDDVIDVNLKGTSLCSKEVLKTMVSQRSGRIINMTSVTGVVGQAGQTNYAASKGGIIGFTKALAREVARFGINVNAIAPGFIETDMVKAMPAEVLAQAVKQVPLQRVGRAEEVAGAALFLASSMSGYTTGHVMHVDGGQAM